MTGRILDFQDPFECLDVWRRFLSDDTEPVLEAEGRHGAALGNVVVVVVGRLLPAGVLGFFPGGLSNLVLADV